MSRPTNQERAAHSIEIARRIAEIIRFAKTGPQKYEAADSVLESLQDAHRSAENDAEAALGIG
jgi:hypothetical protein